MNKPPRRDLLDAVDAEWPTLIAPPAMSDEGLDRLADALGYRPCLGFHPPAPPVRQATVAEIANADALVDAQVNQVLLAGANERLCRTNNRLRSKLARSESFAWVLGVTFVAMTVAVAVMWEVARR